MYRTPVPDDVSGVSSVPLESAGYELLELQYRRLNQFTRARDAVIEALGL